MGKREMSQKGKINMHPKTERNMKCYGMIALNL